MRSSFAYVFGGVHAPGRGALTPGARRAPGSMPRHNCNVTSAKYARMSNPIHTFAHTHTIPATIMTLNRSRAHPHTLTHSDTYVQNHNCVHSHSHTFTTHSLTFIHTHTRSLHNPGCMGPCERPCDGFCVRLCDNFFCAGFCGGLCVWILRKIMHGSVFG